MRVNSFQSSETDIDFSQSPKPRDHQPSSWKLRLAQQQQRKHLKRRLFGQHYNHARVGLNKQKKYLLQQQKNTEIQRQNLILLEKIQKIAKRSVFVDARRRIATQIEEKEATGKERDSYSRRSCDGKEVESQKDNDGNSDHFPMTGRTAKKILYAGEKQVNGRLYEVRTYLEQRKFSILIVLDRKFQRISCSLNDYKAYLQQKMDNNHSNIMEKLKFNGKIFELLDMEDYQIQLQEESAFFLPQISQKKPSGHKMPPRAT